MKSITQEAQETDSIPGLNGFESVQSVPTLQRSEFVFGCSIQKLPLAKSAKSAKSFEIMQRRLGGLRVLGERTAVPLFFSCLSCVS